jgi:hypothetical protein
MTDSRAPHDRHDRILIAAHEAGDLTGPDHDAAASLVRDCPDCATLFTDLRAIAAATHDLPHPARSRDFRLTPEDAARLTHRSWRSIVAAFAGPRFSAARPVGAVFATLGLAGLLLAALPGIPLGSAASTLSKVGAPAVVPASSDNGAGLQPMSAPTGGPATRDAEGGATAAGSGRLQTLQPGQEAPAAPEVAASGGHPTGPTLAGGQFGSDPPSDTATDSAAVTTEESQSPRTPDSTLAIVSGSFLIVGIGLFVLRWTARRLGDG